MHYLNTLFTILVFALFSGMGLAGPRLGQTMDVDWINNMTRCNGEVDGKNDATQWFYPSLWSQFHTACDYWNGSLDESWQYRFPLSDSGSESLLGFEKTESCEARDCWAMFDLLVQGTKCRHDDHWYDAKGAIVDRGCGFFKYEITEGQGRPIPPESGDSMCTPKATWHRGGAQSIPVFCSNAIRGVKEMGQSFIDAETRVGYHWLSEDERVYPPTNDTPYETGWVDFSLQPAPDHCDGHDIEEEVENLTAELCELEMEVLAASQCGDPPPGRSNGGVLVRNCLYWSIVPGGDSYPRARLSEIEDLDSASA